MSRFFLIFIFSFIFYAEISGDDKNKPNSNTEIDWKKKTDEELIVDLQNNELNRLAMEEIAARNSNEIQAKKGYFLQQDVALDVIKCPTEKEYIIIALHTPSWRSSLEEGNKNKYQINNLRELFPRDDKSNSRLDPRHDLVILSFDSKGKLIKPFGGNNMISKGLFLDLNLNGSIECADFTSYGIEGVKNVMVLEVFTVTEEPIPLLYVLFNYGEDTWGYQFVDRDQDGLVEIEFGPKYKGSIQTQVVYRWDPKTTSFDGPIGKEGGHFRRLDEKTRVWESLDKFKKEKMNFPPTNVKTDKSDSIEIIEEELMIDYVEDEEVRRAKADKRVPDAGEAYQYNSLKGLSDKELIAFASAGKTYHEIPEIKKRFSGLPNNILDLSPKEAALKIFNSNRSQEHLSKFQAKVDDREVKAPKSISIHFSYQSSRCYSAFDKNYTLFVSPEKSYLAFNTKSDDGVVFFDYIRSLPSFKIDEIPLSYEEALFIGHVIWWLNQIRTWQENLEDNTSSFTFSTGDGNGAFQMKIDGALVEKPINGRIWGFSNHVSRFTGTYDKEAFLNYVDLVFNKLIDAVIQNRNIKNNENEEKRILSNEQFIEFQTKNLLKNCYHILELFIEAPNHQVSNPIVLDAIIAAGFYRSKNCLPLLKKIEENLSKQKDSRSISDVNMDLESLKAEINKLGDSKKNKKYKEKLEKQKSDLYNELNLLNKDYFGDTWTDKIRMALKVSQRIINEADHLNKIFNWACSHEDGWKWALNRLKSLDKKKYLEALKWWLKDEKSKNWRAQIYDEIKKIDKSTATQIAQDEKTDLQVDAFEVLSELNKIPDEKARVDSLKELILNKKTVWHQRGQAIDLLVPKENPMKYKGIDHILIEVLMRHEEEDMNYSIDNALQGLSMRGYSQALEPALKILKESQYYNKLVLLDHIIVLSNNSGGKHRQEILDYIKPHLKRTSFAPNKLSSLIYAAGFIELVPELGQIATRNQNEYEGVRSIVSGGNAVDLNKRYHGPRLMIALMNEVEPLTKAKLLSKIATGYFEESFQYRSQKEFRDLYNAFDVNEKVALKKFIKENSDIKACEYNMFTKFMYEFLFNYKVKD
jgi:hypothetical protein